DIVVGERIINLRRNRHFISDHSELQVLCLNRRVTYTDWIAVSPYSEFSHEGLPERTTNRNVKSTEVAGVLVNHLFDRRVAGDAEIHGMFHHVLIVEAWIVEQGLQSIALVLESDSAEIKLSYLAQLVADEVKNSHRFDKVVLVAVEVVNKLGVSIDIHK